MSAIDNKAGGDVAAQVKDDASNEKERAQVDLKETSPQKRSASELNNSEDEVKVVKAAKTEHKSDEKNGDTDEKFDDADEEEEAVPEDYDEEDGEGDEDVADEEEDEEDDEA